MPESPDVAPMGPPAGPQIEVRLGMDPQRRVVSVSAKHRLAIEGIDFVLGFATIKSLAAQILAMESTAELQQQSARAGVLRS